MLYDTFMTTINLFVPHWQKKQNTNNNFLITSLRWHPFQAGLICKIFIGTRWVPLIIPVYMQITSKLVRTPCVYPWGQIVSGSWPMTRTLERFICSGYKSSKPSPSLPSVSAQHTSRERERVIFRKLCSTSG